MTTSSLGFLPSTKSSMFLTTILACAAPGRAALCAPVSAMSPTAKMWLYSESKSCSVGFTRMNPFAGLINEGPLDLSKPETSSLLGFWPMAGMIRSASILLPSANWTDESFCSACDSSSGRLTREFNMSLLFVVNYEGPGILKMRDATHSTPSSSNRSLIILCMS